MREFGSADSFEQSRLASLDDCSGFAVKHIERLEARDVALTFQSSKFIK
jgi:hypothetical protein